MYSNKYFDLNNTDVTVVLVEISSYTRCDLTCKDFTIGNKRSQVM